MFRGSGRFPIAAYSEYMPSPRIGVKPSGAFEYDSPFSETDRFGWHISAREQEHQLAPGLSLIGRQIVENLAGLVTGRGVQRIGHHHLKDNPYWPDMLHGRSPVQDRNLFLSPLALAKTQDDKGRLRWTLFGASNDGPARGFWRSFYTAPGEELADDAALQRIRTLLSAVYDLAPGTWTELGDSGFRIRPAGKFPDRPDWEEGPLPGWARQYLLDDSDPADCRYLLTFTPFALLPHTLQSAWLSGSLQLLPSPASMVFWGSPLIRRLGGSLPFADQILLLHAIARHEGRGIRVPQSGWLHHHKAGFAEHDAGLGAVNDRVRRTHRWQRVLRDSDDAAFAREDHVHAALFSAHPDDVRLYGKPMARNAQIWSADFEAVLNGPTAGRSDIAAAVRRMEEGGSFGYRFFYPPMQVGESVTFWNLPVVAFRDLRTGMPRVADCGFTGSMIASGVDKQRVELWPRNANPAGGEGNGRTAHSIRPAPSSPSAPGDAPAGGLTFARTATRAFELRYWKTIADLAEGRYLNKNTGDCVRDAITRSRLPHPGADLDPLADHLLNYYSNLAVRAKMQDCVSIGDLSFRWETDFEFPWMDGWLANQDGRRAERDLITIIPGRSSSEAVIMADHYDTAYMEDVYGDRPGVRGDGARLAAAGADDNHSATAALMLGARVFLDLSRRGMLDCDIWLVHLTGEEFPADCLGARALTQRLIEGSLAMRCTDGTMRNLSATRMRGIFVLDMVAHNNDSAPDIFQISPGTTTQSLWLSDQADSAARAWAAGAAQWNQSARRKGLPRGRRIQGAAEVPVMARHLAPAGEVRLHDNPNSTLFNTDGQIFSDAGLPVVLFMENYDINRVGYHDTQDTMANIDLVYGAAVAAIAIESVARTAAAGRTFTRAG